MPLISRHLTKLGEYEIDRAQWRLSCNDEPIALNRKTFDLLLYLVDHPDQVVSKQELLQALWPEQFIEESNLTRHVFLLRKALSRHESGEKIIETVPGRGYRLTTPVINIEPVMDALTISSNESITRITFEEEQLEDESQVLDEKGRSRTLGIAARIAVFVAVAAVLSVAVWYGWQRWREHADGPPVKIVLTPLEGSTGDAILDHSLLNVLRMNLAQSPLVSVLPDATVSETLTQMRLNPHDPLTMTTAREVCERTNSQAFVHGSVARSGHRYLLTEEATACADGKTIAESNEEVYRAEDLPHSIESLGEKIRKGLGESRQSIARFNMPLFDGDNTASLDALKAYTHGTEELRFGHVPEAISLFKASVGYDPNFAIAEYGLAAGYADAGDRVDARAAIDAAYRLKDRASRPVQFTIASAYMQTNTQDLYANIRNDQNWAALYPNFFLPWDKLSAEQRELGRYVESVPNSKRALTLFPRYSVLIVNHATGLLQSRDFKGAQSTLEHAIADGIDGDLIRTRSLELAYVLQDQGLLQRQREWLKKHADSAVLTLAEARIAVAEGRFATARRLATSTREISVEHGVAVAGDRFIQTIALELMEAGDVDAGRQMFQSVPVDVEEGQDLVGLVYAGDITRATAELKAMQAKYPNGTLWNLYWGPQIRSAIAMKEHKAREAASILETARPAEMRELTIPWLRGNAYLAAEEPKLAEKDFREVIEHPEVDPTAFEIKLAWLGLGRALAADHNSAAAIDAYRHFLDLWANADPEAAFLKSAKLEIAMLQKQQPR